MDFHCPQFSFKTNIWKTMWLCYLQDGGERKLERNQELDAGGPRTTSSEPLWAKSKVRAVRELPGGFEDLQGECTTCLSWGLQGAVDVISAHHQGHRQQPRLQAPSQERGSQCPSNTARDEEAVCGRTTPKAFVELWFTYHTIHPLSVQFIVFEYSQANIHCATVATV